MAKWRKFELGLFKLPLENSSPKMFVGIRYHKWGKQAIVRVANRNKAIPVGSTGVFRIAEDGNLKVWDTSGEIYWSTHLENSSSTNQIVKLTDSVNLVLSDDDDDDQSSKSLWESFKYPTDTFLPGMKMDENITLVSWTDSGDPTSGQFEFKQDRLGVDIYTITKKITFSPLKLRLGGTLQDRVIYESNEHQPCSPFVQSTLDLLSFSKGCLPLTRWDELNNFFKKAGAVVVFGLNELSGKREDNKPPQGSAEGAWNSSNAKSLMRYTVNQGFTIQGWELGNELSGKGIGVRVSADQYASDINTLQDTEQNIYAGFDVKPVVMGPGGFFEENWFTEFIQKTTKSLQVVTHHIYNLGPGSNDHLIDAILDPSHLDSVSYKYNRLQSILKNSETQVVAWVGEADGASNSGHNLVTNAFVFSFWYLDQLRMTSPLIPKRIVDKLWFAETMAYSTLPLFQILITIVPSFGTQGITLLLINLDGYVTVQVRVSAENTTGPKVANLTREEYHLTPKDGDLHSQTMLLNGKMLTVDSSGVIPPLEPISVSQSDPITIAPFSIVFVQIPYINFSVCD